MRDHLFLIFGSVNEIKRATAIECLDLRNPESEFFVIQLRGPYTHLVHPMIFESKQEDDILYVFGQDTCCNLQRLEVIWDENGRPIKA